MNLVGMKDAKVGQRVVFSYYGGSNYGGTRTVDVEEMETDRMKGTDVNKQKKRQYLFHNCRNIVVIDSPHELQSTVVSFTEAREMLREKVDNLDGETLAELLGAITGSNTSTFDAEGGMVVLEHEVVEPHFTFPFRANDACCVVNKEEENLTMELTGEDKTVNIDGLPVTPMELVKQLSLHLGLTEE